MPVEQRHLAPVLRDRAARASSAMPAIEPIRLAASSGISTVLEFGLAAMLAQRLGVFLRHEIVDRLHVAGGDRLR